jgi:hypothetical protein
VVGTVHAVEAVNGRIADDDTHADLPKHAFGSCAICTRRLLAQKQARPVETHRETNRKLTTRFLVQTSVVPAAKGGRA